CTRTYQCTFPDRNARQNRGIASDRCARFHQSRFDSPVAFRLQAPIGVCRLWITIVDEHYAVTDKYLILYRDAFAQKGMGRDLAASANRGVFLNLDECADFGTVPERASVEVYQVGLKNPYVFSEANVSGYRHEPIPYVLSCHLLSSTVGTRGCGRTSSLPPCAGNRRVAPCHYPLSTAR